MKETLENYSVVQLFLQFFNINKKKKIGVKRTIFLFCLLNKFIQIKSWINLFDRFINKYCIHFVKQRFDIVSIFNLNHLQE